MAALEGKKILLGVCGSIAAYKAAYLTRMLVKAGAEVKIIMTSSAAEFITPLTLSTLSKNNVYSDLMEEGEWNNHVALGLWADLMLIAPATAHTIAGMSHGLCDSMLLACYLSAKCPVMIAPAMDLDMWAHPATQSNINLLLSQGVQLIAVEHGELASGLIGEGRMAEPENILSEIEKHFSKKKRLDGLKVFITAGPTVEDIDPVRYISNRSTGKMGICLAEEFADRGAQVQLILGPTSLSSNHPAVITHPVRSAEEMYKCAMDHAKSSDLMIFSAAVADFKPSQTANQKIKKDEAGLSIALSKTKDIAASFGAIKQSKQYSIGFALETNNAIEYGRSKLERKKFDIIVINSLENPGAGFGTTTNQIHILDNKGGQKSYSLKKKEEVAVDIADYFEEYRNAG